jgi:putative phage-type endonuclease
MIKYHYEIEQNTEEWHQIRLGIVTASNVNVIMTPTGKPAKNQKVREYAYAIAAQREYGFIEDSFQSYDMIRGHIQEGIARDIYNDNYAPIKECGFITNDNYGFRIGCSPDGLVDEDGGIEIKSRLAKFQFQTIINGEVPNEYMNQIQAFLLVSGRDYCDYVQYSNGLPLFVKRVTVDPVRREAIIEAITAFEDEVQGILDDYREKSASLVKTERVDVITDDYIEGSE